MSTTPETLIEELIALDPMLAEKREDLVRVVRELSAERPDTRWRPEFHDELLRVLRARMENEGEGAPTFSSSFLTSLMENRFLFAGGGAVLGALLMFVVVQLPWQPQGGSTDLVAVEEVAPNAFGSLRLQDDAATGLGGGGGAVESAPAPRAMGSGGDSKMIAPGEFTQVRYVYDGPIDLPEGDIQVYKRIKPSGSPAAGSAMGGFVHDVVDLTSFGSLALETLSAREKGKGYTLYANYAEGSLSINKNYDPTDRPDTHCTTEECYEQYRLGEADMISEEQLVNIARQFVQQHGFDLSSYGDPVVTDDWRAMLARSEDQSYFYYPEQQTVVFPMLIDGLPVYEEYGYPFGLSVSIEVRNKTVANVYNIYVQNYQASAYAATQDEANVREAVERGGVYAWLSPEARLVDATLGEPTRVFVRMNRWEPQASEGYDLFVPALSFPVTTMPTDTYENREYVVIPLAEELLDTDNSPRPMPLLESAEAPAVEEEVME